ncbi:MAG: beta-lactamase family protein [Deltaproteobacteria bacterium]|nr:beta-lactamase family protein [Deltaproteobacteria bacterium]
MAITFRTIFFHLCSAIAVALVALAVVGTAGWASAQDKDMAFRLEAALDQAMAASGAPGAIAGVWKGDFAWTSAKGLADVGAGAPMKTSYVWRIGSVTKTFTATAVLRLCDKGMLSLEDPLSRFRPDFPKADKITVRQLLQHTSGIFSWDEDDDTRAAIVKHPDREWTMEKMIRLAAGKPFYFEPGSAYHYSNVGYFLLAPIIEKVTGKGVAQVIREEIADPLNLGHTYMPAGPRYKDEVIRGYMAEGDTLKDTTGLRFADVINYELAHTPGGMVSTLADLKVWLKALATGRLLSARMHKEQFRTIPNPGSKGAGYGLGVSTYHGWIGHSGGVAGSMCNVYMNPKEDTVIIHYFNKLDPVNLEQNAADLKALGGVLLEMMRITCPGTL